ncbi:helix-hairpin-helix domain-containing protein [Micromonospora sp. LOL_024]|uniref:helix-hairpin-helix domain-containing protein n=1 Tax=Micromonospora sp. LOL_024 TaxID=3345412 RepID=UPI003A838F29
MGESFGSWLILLVALLVGLAAGWVLLRRRRDEPPAPTTGTTGEGTTEAAPAATAGTDQPAAEAQPPTDESARAGAEAAGTEATGTEPTDAPTDAAAVSALDGPAEDATPTPRPAVAVPPVRPSAATEPTTAPEPALVAAEPAVVAEPAPEPVTAPEPAAVAVAPEGGADDFRRIQGVGPKMAAALHGAGIRTYRQLAELDEATLRDTVKSAGLRATASLVTWPQQAKVLAAQADDNA